MGDVRAAPVQVVQSAPGLAVAVLGLFLFDIVLLQRLAPAPAGVNQLCLVTNTRARGAGHDDRFESLRSENRAAAMGGEVIVVVGKHRGAIEMLPGWSDAEHSGIAAANDFAQAIFGIARAEAPDTRGITQLGLALMDIKVDGLRRGAVDDNAVVAGGFEIGPLVAPRPRVV